MSSLTTLSQSFPLHTSKKTVNVYKTEVFTHPMGTVLDTTFFVEHDGKLVAEDLPDENALEEVVNRLIQQDMERVTE